MDTLELIQAVQPGGIETSDDVIIVHSLIERWNTGMNEHKISIILYLLGLYSFEWSPSAD